MSTFANSLLPVAGQSGTQFLEVEPPVFDNYTVEADGFEIEPTAEFVDEFDNAAEWVGSSTSQAVLKLTGTIKIHAGHIPLQLGAMIKGKGGVGANFLDDWFYIKACKVVTAIAGRPAKMSFEFWYGTTMSANAEAATSPFTVDID